MAASAAVCGSAFSQNFTMEVTNPDPLGLGAFVPESTLPELGLEGNVKGDWDYGLEAQAVYNSNFFLTDGGEESEMALFLGPWVRYTSDPEGGATAALLVNYSPILRGYLENSDLNDVDQAGDVTLRVRGSRSEAALFGRYQEISGTDRLTGDFVTGSVMTGGIRASRQIATRTMLLGGWSAAVSDYGSSANEGAEIYTTYVGGSWAATPRFSIGSTLRYTLSESDNTGTRDAWALLVDARYQLGERIWLAASLGPEFATTSGGTTSGDENSFRLAGDLEASYAINEWWTWRNNFRSATVPSPTERNYLVNDIGFTTGLQRELRYGAIGGGLEYHFSEYEDVGTVLSARGNEQNLALYLTYNRKFFLDRLDFESRVRYAINDGEVDWKQLVVTAGFNVEF